MRKVIVFFVGLSMIIGMSGCAKDSAETAPKESVVQTTKEETVEAIEETTEEITEEVTEEITTAQETTITQVQNEFSYSNMKNLEFSFLSGAGGWSTELYINEDGSFYGTYHDSDMGDVGKKYPNGTMHYCSFTGKFGSLTKVDEFTYKTTVEQMDYKNKPGEKEIIDGVAQNETWEIGKLYEYYIDISNYESDEENIFEIYTIYY